MKWSHPKGCGHNDHGHFSTEETMSKAQKRGNSWRVRVYDYTDADGKIHNRSFTAPTKAEAEWLAADFKANKKGRPTNKMTVGKAIDKYLLLRPMLSPTTITGYEKMRKYGFQDIMDLAVDDLDDIVMQEAVNNEAMRISERTGMPISVKTLKNEYGLLVAALRVVCKKVFIVTLPTRHKHYKEYPEVPDVLKALKGTDIELPCLLALWGSFRMSEIRGIMCHDYRNGIVTIDRVVVDTNKGTVVKENAKTQKSLRQRQFSPYICDLIENTDTYRHYKATGEDAFLIEMSRDKIYRHWKHICEQNGWDLTFHDLRHLFASLTITLGIPLKYQMDFGGWENEKTIMQTYQHTLTDERLRYEQVINEWFEKNIPQPLAQDFETP